MTEAKSKFEVNVKRTEWGFVVVEAKDEKEAVELVEYEQGANGDVIWNKEDFVVQGVKERGSER